MTHFYISSGFSFKEVDEDTWWYYFNYFDSLSPLNCYYEDLMYPFVRQCFSYKLTEINVCLCYLEYPIN